LSQAYWLRVKLDDQVTETPWTDNLSLLLLGITLIMSVRYQTAMRRRWSLSLIVTMLLHWSLGACAALADTICLEPDGRVVWEQAGKPCAAEALEQATGKPCIDIQTQDGHDDHSPVPSKLQLADLQTPHLIPALTWLLPSIPAHHAVKPDATGPPTTPFSVIIRETAYLLI
jgi:hypothetical protein